MKKIIPKIIATNKSVYHKYLIENKFEAGLCLEGWEVKSLRSYNVVLNNSYIIFKNTEAYLFGASFKPIIHEPSYMFFDSYRNRKLLLSRRELDFIYGKAHYKRYTVVAISIYWKNSWCKIEIGIAKGKKEYDKRTDIKEREWKINKERLMKKNKNNYLNNYFLYCIILNTFMGLI